MNNSIKKDKFSKIIDRAKEIRFFYKLAKKYDFNVGNPEITGYENFEYMDSSKILDKI